MREINGGGGCSSYKGPAMSQSLCVCLSVCLFVCPCVCICLSVFASPCLFLYLTGITFKLFPVDTIKTLNLNESILLGEASHIMLQCVFA